MHCCIGRLLDLSIEANRPEEILPMLKAGLLPALTTCGAVLVRAELKMTLTT